MLWQCGECKQTLVMVVMAHFFCFLPIHNLPGDISIERGSRMSASRSAGSITATPCYSVSSLESSEQHCKQANIIITHPPLPSLPSLLNQGLCYFHQTMGLMSIISAISLLSSHHCKWKSLLRYNVFMVDEWKSDYIQVWVCRWRVGEARWWYVWKVSFVGTQGQPGTVTNEW